MNIKNSVVILLLALSVVLLAAYDISKQKEISPADGNMTAEKIDIMKQEWCNHNKEHNPDLPSMKDNCD